MARRSVEWSKELAKDLKNLQFAQAFIQESLNQGLSIQEVLSKVVRAYGVREFAEKIKLPSSNLIRALSPNYNPTIATINAILAPFKMKVSIAPVSRKKAA